MAKVIGLPTELFNDILCNTDWKKDFRCYGISFNKLEDCQKWVKLKKPDADSEQYSGEEKAYIIPCLYRKSPPFDVGLSNAILVTYQKLADILRYLEMEDHHESNVSLDMEEIQDEVVLDQAKTIRVAKVLSTLPSITTVIMEHCLRKHFEVSRLLREGEIFEVELHKPNSHISYELIYIQSIHFKVINIESISGSSSSEEEIGCLVGPNTGISIGNAVQSYLPKIYEKWAPAEPGRLIPICPTGLMESFCRLKLIFDLFIRDHTDEFLPTLLLHGMRGSGKKTVVRSLAAIYGLNLITVNCYDYWEIETASHNYRDLIAECKKLTPCILLMENIELLGRDDQMMDNLKGEDFLDAIREMQKTSDEMMYPLILVATTDGSDSDLLPIVRSIFIDSVAFGNLKNEQAMENLIWLLSERGKNYRPSEKVLNKLKCFGFADLAKLANLSVKFQREECRDGGPEVTDNHILRGIEILDKLFSQSIGSAKVPSVTWDEVGGVDDVKDHLITALGTKRIPPYFRESGILFFGPPGTGKTLLAKAVATEFNYNFISVKGPELMNMYVGQSEKNVREVFKRARDAAPCIIFFDELDSIAPNRGNSGGVTDRVVSQLLTEMDGMENNEDVYIIGATNRPDLIDSALMRPGRFDTKFYIGVCSDDRKKLSVIKALTKRFSLNSDVNLEEIIKKLPTVTGADIYSICSSAWFESAKRLIRKREETGKAHFSELIVRQEDFETAVEHFVPSLSKEVIDSYQQYDRS